MTDPKKTDAQKLFTPAQNEAASVLDTAIWSASPKKQREQDLATAALNLLLEVSEVINGMGHKAEQMPSGDQDQGKTRLHIAIGTSEPVILRQQGPHLYFEITKNELVDITEEAIKGLEFDPLLKKFHGPQEPHQGQTREVPGVVHVMNKLVSVWLQSNPPEQ